MTDKTELPDGAEAFILNWAEAVSGWGLTRSAGRLHGLLLIADEPLAAEEMTATLAIARSNVSTALSDLTAMGLIEAMPRLGVRRTSYRAIADPAAMTAAVFAYQKARLFDPVQSALQVKLGGSPGKRLSALRRHADALAPLLDDVPVPDKPKKKKKKKG